MTDGTPHAALAPDRRKRVKSLRWRRSYLLATVERLRKRIRLNEAKIAQIDTELAALGVPARNLPPLTRNRSPHFAHGELPRRTLAVLREARCPMHADP